MKAEEKLAFEEFVREEEQREKQRREQKLVQEQKCLAEDTQKAKAVQVAERLAKQRAEQLALRKRIMSDAARSYAERGKKQYDLAQPPMGEVGWLVFDRATGELLGEARAWRAYEAWKSVSPPQSFPACRCVQCADWDAAEAKFRIKKMNGGSNGH